ncbi:hypothetical protein HXX76_007508 [Chlamydomonas incerta]|uniref:Coenzyme Q-binding protein COQ10 START domain-containing protein n=1 Tax=Chlamydomonas incerta TaxID=51695 RepID=A0A835T2B5_CHLIN|nr:hypothetical protein HXX76_007508 [Chlamydomonas incerta]|eukprot:KAG2434613.1 hypothetical protein HXX76_007508 [Chlamydomonas incerta]
MTGRRALAAAVGAVCRAGAPVECRLAAAAASAPSLLVPTSSAALWTASESVQPSLRLAEEARALSHAHATTSSRGFFTAYTPASKVFKQRKLVGWAPEQLYAVVSRVEDYHLFVPWCQKSRVTRPPGPLPPQLQHHLRGQGRAPAAAAGRAAGGAAGAGAATAAGAGAATAGQPTYMEAELEVGFQVLVERYTSQIYLTPGRSVRSAVPDSSLFDHLDSTWTMEPGPAPATCWLSFHVDFAFRSQLHGVLADLFFSEVVKQMSNAFEGRCAKLYGPSSLLSPPRSRAGGATATATHAHGHQQPHATSHPASHSSSTRAGSSGASSSSSSTAAGTGGSGSASAGPGRPGHSPPRPMPPKAPAAGTGGAGSGAPGKTAAAAAAASGPRCSSAAGGPAAAVAGQ